MADDKKKKDVRVKDQPSADFRRAMTEDPEKRHHGDAEHAFTTDSPRWDEPGSSREERGYPPEGGEPVGTPRRE